jgi:large subunit ribosomal protein L21
MQQAVIATGGKQYLVSPGVELKIEKIKGDFKAGDKLSFDQVLMTSEGSNVTVGAPTVTGAMVTGTLEEIGRAKKIVVIHYKAKVRHRKKAGHRQPYFRVKIDAISTK